MSRLDKSVLGGLIAIFLFITHTVRLRERLACTAAADGTGLSCERVQTKIIASSDEHFHIPDASTVRLQLSSQTTSSHNAVSTSAIEARDETGRRVVLMSVPEQKVVYAEDLERSLQTLSQSASRSVTFERDESRNLWILLCLMVGLGLLYAAMLKLRNAARAAVVLAALNAAHAPGCEAASGYTADHSVTPRMSTQGGAGRAQPRVVLAHANH
jgi:hypothetical protein